MHCFSEVQSLFSVYFAIHLEIKVQVARDVELKQVSIKWLFAVAFLT